MAVKQKSSVNRSTSGSPRPEQTLPPRVDRRRRWFGLAMAVFVVCTFAALVQFPRPDAYHAPPTFSATWWRTPIEVNAVARLPVIESDLRDLFVLPGTEKIWVVGAGSLILHSEDGGRTWEKQAVQNGLPPAAAARTSPEPFGLISPAYAGEKSDKKQAKAEAIKQRQPTVQQAGDAGNRTQQQAQLAAEDADSLYARHLNSITFLDENTGWAVGNRGRLLATKDGGATWRVQQSGTQYDLNDVVFAPTGRGLIVGDGGTILYTTNPGLSWLPGGRQILGGKEIRAAAPTGQNTFRVAGPGFARVDVPESGESPPKVTDETRDGRVHYYALHFPGNRTTGWAVGSFGTIKHTTDSGLTWNTRNDTITDPLFAVHFVNDSTGWVAGWQGAIYKTSDGGASWQKQPTGTNNTINALQFRDKNRGWAVGHRGTLLATLDGGATWFQQTRDPATDAGAYWKLPAPWYYLSWLLVAFLLVPGLRKPDTTDTRYVRESIENVLISDRPLEMGDPDPLKFKPIAFGLSRFIRNENTLPPLTIAITGNWGSGKSSLMNLLKADLRQHKFQSVWFNAWHHQKEEHLLAALLENVKRQAVPPWLSLMNIDFRLRLLVIRLRRNWLGFLALILLSSAVCSFLLASLAARPSLVRELLQLQLPTNAEGGAIIALLTSCVGVAGVGGVARMLWRAVRAFGLEPARLMASMSGRFSVRDFMAQTGFRYRFEREFRDVTRALNPHNLVILIDDLDRCRPENVLEVLEAVNFLVASGGCFVVLGLDLKRVERCVGLGFKEVAEELWDEESSGDSHAQNGQTNGESESAAGKRRRAEFARQYLEKLINIEVPVPEPTTDQSKQLLVPEEQDGARTASPRAANLLRTVKRVLTAPLILAAIVAAFWFGSTVASRWQPSTPSTAPARPTTTDEKEQQLPNPLPLDPEADKSPARTGRFEPGKPTDVPGWVFFLPLAALLLAGVWRLTLRPETVVKDSEAFRTALQVWHRVIISRQNTPRAIKRFMNRLRFLAMGLPQAQPEPESGPGLLAALFKKKTAPPADQLQENGPMDEPTLVALSALHHFNSAWLEDEELWQKIKTGEVETTENGYSADEAENISRILKKAIEKHQRSSTWPPSEDAVAKLLNLSHGIRVS
ncbi:MAG: YCF48-related protein [bacterium]